MKNADKYDELSLLRTDDGSYTLSNAALGETYHNRHGAITESKHVFIEHGLKPLLHFKEILLLEVGFGTGLNAWLTWNFCVTNQLRVQYQTLEPLPLPEQLCPVPEGYSEMEQKRWIDLHQSAWEQRCLFDQFFNLYKTTQTVEKFLADPNSFDLVYFDAFAPPYQPEIWEAPVFEHIFSLLKPGGILVTYCAKGAVRRTMQQCGFQVERLAGPPGKREMLRAKKV
jgi:tRNA U34 5-methylaminomethyl-2-thiouridine-forming methyltransferase MnmC